MKLASTRLARMRLAAPLALLMVAAAPPVGDAPFTALKHPYEETSEARAAVDAVLAAPPAGKPVLLVFGANWCPDCRVLAGIMTDDRVAPWINEHFTVLKVDVGRMNRNMDLGKRYGLDIHEIPSVVVVGPDGKPRNPGETTALGDARSMQPSEVLAILDRWAAQGGAGS